MTIDFDALPAQTLRERRRKLANMAAYYADCAREAHAAEVDFESRHALADAILAAIVETEALLNPLIVERDPVKDACADSMSVASAKPRTLPGATLAERNAASALKAANYAAARQREQAARDAEDAAPTVEALIALGYSVLRAKTIIACRQGRCASARFAAALQRGVEEDLRCR
jgi:hypothetical protein